MTQIETVRVDLSLLKHDLQNMRERTGETERNMSTMEDIESPLETDNRELRVELKACQMKIDLENDQGTRI